MNFQEAENAYKELRAQYSAGKLSNADFEAEVAKLKLQDAEGRWWQIGVQSGDWYFHDGEKWSKAQPPPSGAPAEIPTTAPEGAGPPVVQTAQRSTAIPARLLSPAPAGRGNGGLPIPLLVGIIAVVALVGAALVYGAFLLVSGQLGSSGTAVRATTTPTVSIAIVPTYVLPTVPPPPPTDTPLPVPTPAVTATAPAVATNTRAPVTPRPTAVKKSPTPAAPTPTPLPAAPPGVYVTQMALSPSHPVFGDEVTFQATFLNTSGTYTMRTWFVKLYACSGACTADELRRSIGETPKATKEVPTGSTVFSVGTWKAGIGTCNYVASPYYVDQFQNVVALTKPDGSQLYATIRLCQ